jgi:uncharacterized NAD(P)/FAD-binding protein YdhS
MTLRSTLDLVIVGAGFSGTALAIQLARRAPAGFAIALVDPSTGTGRGRAYTDPSRQLLLNVPAARMSLDPAAPADFAEWWAGERGATVAAVAADFAPRADYGRYVHARWREATSSSDCRIERVFSTVVDVAPRNDGLVATLDDGRTLVTRALVLAVGHAPPVVPSALEPAARAGRLLDPLKPQVLEQLRRDASLLIVGTGLTTVDALGRLAELGHRGSILCLSRHGRWPAVHRPPGTGTPPPVDASALSASPRSALHHVRDLVARHLSGGGDWRAVIDALRPHTAPTWRAWNDRARRQALRHLRSPWDVHRHRMAPAADLAREQLATRVQVETCAARVLDTRTEDDGQLRVDILRRGARTTEQLKVDALLLGLAPAIAFGQRKDALASALLARGLVHDDAAGFGIDVDTSGQPLDAAGNPTPGFYAIGPLLRGRDWETTAVPEIREQAAQLAAQLLCN